MELRQLQLLLSVIESGGYAPAGKLLNVSHSAIHRQIRILEQELGCPLLARSGRAVTPTESGRLLADLTRRLCQEISDAQCRVSDLNSLRQGSLRIGASSSVLVSFLPAVLQKFLKSFPGVRLHLVTGVADDLIEDLTERKLDMAIIFNPSDVPRPLPGLESVFLYREQFDWAVGKRHPLARKVRVELAELAGYPLITLPPRSHLRRACDRLFAARGLVPTVITELENEEAIDRLIEINMGFALRSRRRQASARIHCFRIPNRTIECEVKAVLQKRMIFPAPLWSSSACAGKRSRPQFRPETHRLSWRSRSAGETHGEERLGSGGAELQDARIQDESSSAAIEANSLDANATPGTFMCTERARSRLMRRVCFGGVIA